LKIDDQIAFEQEVNSLLSLRHPNIVLLIGICQNGDFKLIVTEFCHNFSIDHHLYNIDSPVLRKGRHRAFTMKKKIEILLDVTMGMMYLHGLGLVHRDLKTSNILLDKMFNAKVCDFGQCRYLSNANTMTAGIGTIHYMSPEVLLGKDYNESSDVYSFGIIMHEMLFESRPFQTGNAINPVNIGIMVAQNGLRPTIPEESYSKQEKEYLELMKQCWKQEKQSRPTFEKVHHMLTEILNEL
jgi:serine/threonine protein kinase